MIFYFNASGDSIGMSPERVYQGSVKANKVYCVCPIPNSAVVSVTYQLPNGDASASYIMNRVMLENQREMVDKNGITFNMWEVDLAEVASAYPGSVGVQFTFAMTSGEVLNSAYCRFYVERGVEIDPPIVGDTYQQVISFLSSLNEKVNQCELSVIDSANKVESTQNSVRMLQSTYGGLNSAVAVNSSNISIINRKMEFLSTVIGDAIIGEAEISDDFTERVTAGGLKVINGTESTVLKIEGSTVEGDDGNFYDAKFYGIKSSGANMFNIDRSNVETSNFTMKFDKNTGTVTLNGYKSANTTLIYMQTLCDSGKNYSIAFEHLGGNAIDTQGVENLEPLSVYLNNGSYVHSIMANQSKDFVSGVIGAEGGKIYIAVVTNNKTDIVFNDYKFKVMAVEGAYTKSNMLRHIPYGVGDESFRLSESVSLGKYDYIDVVNGLIVKRTGYVVKETPFTQEEIALYKNAEVSTDNTKLVYQLDSETTLYFAIPKGYIAYRGGRESLVYPNGEEVSPAPITVRQKYYINVGD